MRSMQSKLATVIPQPQTVIIGDPLENGLKIGDISLPPQWVELLTLLEFKELPEVLVLEDSRIQSEGYEIVVGDRIEISASTQTGAFYGLTTLKKLGDEFGAVLSIKDQPSFAWRGVHLDVSRTFFTVAEVKRFIRLIAEHKFNKLHLHLNDDQGWRVEVPDWPLLTTVGAWRSSTPVAHADDGYTSDGIRHGGFYTAADLQEIRQYAALRGVQIVPEIDLPGHAQAVLAAYPELGNTGERFEVWTDWGISEHVLNVSEAALKFAEEVVLYVGKLFPGSPFHIGGDECPTTEWEKSAAAQQVMSQHGFTSFHDLQRLYTDRLTAVLQSQGHQVLAWDEVADNEIPSGLTVMAWRGMEKGLEALEKGYSVILAPMEYLYLDWANSPDISEPIAQTKPPLATTIERSYSFNEELKKIPAGLRPNLLGIHAALWTEYIHTASHLDYMAFPRLCAISEVAWGTASTISELKERLPIHLEGHRRENVNFRELDGNFGL